MPEGLTYIITVPTTTVAVGTKGAGSVNNGDVTIPVPIVSVIPIQIAGLNPMQQCDIGECRSLAGICCERLPVFGNTQPSKTLPVTQIPVSTPTYENDFTPFFFDIQLAGTTVTWSIEKCGGNNVWTKKATITNNTYGKYQALGTISGHTTYTGFTVNWARVMVAFGVGVYRIKMTSISRGTIYSYCFVSSEYFLRKFNCNQATRTTKFEIILPDLIGDCHNNGYLFDTCGMNLYDSIRIGGFFGTKTVPTYSRIFNKFQSGQIEPVHNEALPKWRFDSLMLTEEYHDRLEVYMMMAQNILVSDYNILNVTKQIKQFSVTPSGSYDLTDYNSALPPRSTATVEFNAGTQNLIASNCCNLK